MAFNLRIIVSLEKISDKLISINTVNIEPVQVASKHVALAALRNTDEHFTGGLLSIKSNSINLSKKPFSYQKSVEQQDKLSADDLVKVTLPTTLFKDAGLQKTSTQIVKFVYYTDATLFPVIKKVNGLVEKTRTVFSGVFSIHVGQTEYVNLTQDLRFTINSKQDVTSRGHIKCVYWNFSANRE